jgi:hypothetical protein
MGVLSPQKIPHCQNKSEKDKINISNTQIHDNSFSLLGKGILIKSGKVKLILRAQNSHLSEMM